jgi:hypothetical protein
MTTAPDPAESTALEEAAPTEETAPAATVADAGPAEAPDADDDLERFPPRPVAEAVTLAAVVVVPLASIAAAMASRSWLTLAYLVLAPVVLAVWVAGVVAFTKVLRRRSQVRLGLGQVPRRYHVYGWVWAASFVGAALSPFVGGEDAWLAKIGVLVACALVTGIGAATVWTSYVRDMAWRDQPED